MTYPAAPERCVFLDGHREVVVVLPGRDLPFRFKIDGLGYLPTGASELKAVDIVLMNQADFIDSYWARLNSVAAVEGSEDYGELSSVAANIWRRVHHGEIEKHHFKSIFWKKFLGDKSWMPIAAAGDAFVALELIGRGRCQHGVPSREELLVRMHFDLGRVHEQYHPGAKAFFESVAREIVETEHHVLRTHGVVGPGPVSGSKRQALDKLLRSLLTRFERLAEREGIQKEALHLEALVRYLQAMDVFFENQLRQIENQLSPLGRRLFRFLHIAGPRRADGLVPIPAIHSMPIKNALLFICGDQEGRWSLPEAVIAPDLLEVLDGADPTDPRYASAVHKAVGFTIAYPMWASETRSKQKESARHKRSS